MVADLESFLGDYPYMSIRPTSSPDTVVEGRFQFVAKHYDHPKITDSYDLCICVPGAFPRDLPQVMELQKKIPRDDKFHVNHDGTLCLGSPLRLLWKLSQRPSLSGFTDHCLVPYLYSVSHKLRFGGGVIFNELKHGPEGVIQDYLDLFGLESPEQVRRVLLLLGMKKRRANKETCPCECGKRLGRCPFNRKLHQFRKRGDRTWFRANQI